MKKKIFLVSLMSILLTLSVAYAQHPQHLFYRPIVFIFNSSGSIPSIVPLSLDNPLPCDIEAYQTEDGIEIIVNDVALVGSYNVYVFDHHHGEIVYSNSFFWQDGSTSFISTSTWPEDTYTLYIAIPGGWLEGEFEIDDFLIP